MRRRVHSRRLDENSKSKTSPLRRRWFLNIWVALMAAMPLVLVIGTIRSPDVPVDTALPYFLGLMTLTFPSGLLVMLGAVYCTPLLDHLSDVLPGPLPSLLQVVAFVSLWAAFLAVGYLQWFWLVPRLYSRVRDSLREGFRWR